MPTWAGRPVIIDDKAMSDIDTSACRSPSRALRRFKRGIIGHVRIVPKMVAYHLPSQGLYVMHSAFYRELTAARI